MPEVPEGPFAWHRLKHYVEQQGVRPTQRANNAAPGYQRPSFAIMLWSNYAPDMGTVVGGARRTAVIHQDARYGRLRSEQDGVYIDNMNLKSQIISGAFRQDMLWSAVAWTPALYLYSTSIAKPEAVQKQSLAATPDPLREWATSHLEPCLVPRAASTCSEVKKAVAAFLCCGERSPQLQVRMRAAGFTLDYRASGGSKRVCRYMFDADTEARFVKLRPEPA